MNANPSPVTLFVYRRLAHTRMTVEALQKNDLARETDLIVFSDGAKTTAEVDAVRAVRQYVNNIRGFKSVQVVERATNYGLARSLIEGVSLVVREYGRIIVLEDDVVTSSSFLSFMNAALFRYVDQPNVWHISGWNYPIDPTGLGDAFLLRVMNCWGWATWADRWGYFRKDPDYLVGAWSRDQIHRFNLNGAHDFWAQVQLNRTGRVNTWAVFWYASIFESNGLCLNPAVSYVHNIGLDGSGENCAVTEQYSGGMQAQFHCEFPPAERQESILAVERVRKFYLEQRSDVFARASSLLRRVFSRLRLHHG